jgi:hypothetical protein
MHRLISFTALAVSFIHFCSPAHAAESQPAGHLSVSKGKFVRAGQEFRGIGINYFDLFRRLIDPAPISATRRSPREGLAILAEKEIPFVRFAACGFYPVELRRYVDDPESYFALLDGVVAEAEKQGIGLIPSLFWAFFAVPDLVGEPMQAWGDPQSRTREYMRRYTKDMVSRYRGSPAIWAWEFGNEYMLESDLPNLISAEKWKVPDRGTPKDRGEEDRLRSSDVVSAYREFAELVRSLDPARPILTGDTVPRAAAWHLRRGLDFEPDSLEEGQEVLVENNPTPVDTISIHLYADAARKPDYFRPQTPVGETLAAAMEVSTKTGKPLWLGEFGADPEKPAESRLKEVKEFVQLIEKLGIPLAALWVFDCDNPDVAAWNVEPGNENAGALEILREANRRLRSKTVSP